MANHVNDFIHDLSWSDVPPAAQDFTRLCLIDLLGVAASGIEYYRRLWPTDFVDDGNSESRLFTGSGFDGLANF